MPASLAPLGPRPLPGLRRRARPPVRRPARPRRRRRRRADVVDLGCGPGNLTRLLADRWPGRRVRGLDSSPEMVGGAPARRAGRRLRGRRPAGLGGVGRAGRRASSATRRCSGCPTTSTCCPRSPTGCAPAAGWRSRCPATSTSPATRSGPSSPPEPPYDAHTRDVAVPASHDPEDYLAALAGCGLEVDVWETTYLHVLTGEDPVFTLGLRHRRPADAAGAADGPAGRLRGGVPRAAARGLPGPRPRRRAARSAGSSPSAGEGRPMRLHHVQLAIPAGGEPEPAGSGSRGSACRRSTSRRALRGRGGLWLRVGSGRDPPRRRGAVPPGPQGPPRRCCSTTSPTLDATAARLEALGYDVDHRERDTFPGHVRVHVHDGHGNRVELLCPGDVTPGNTRGRVGVAHP